MLFDEISFDSLARQLSGWGNSSRKIVYVAGSCLHKCELHEQVSSKSRVESCQLFDGFPGFAFGVNFWEGTWRSVYHAIAFAFVEQCRDRADNDINLTAE